ncbi:hypothetical protein BDB13_5849 [Rhodococcus sp. OK302]|nr:hypothetical protein BDB13_5849 [Rhodococcus sp. OK302]
MCTTYVLVVLDYYVERALVAESHRLGLGTERCRDIGFTRKSTRNPEAFSPSTKSGSLNNSVGCVPMNRGSQIHFGTGLWRA